MKRILFYSIFFVLLFSVFNGEARKKRPFHEQKEIDFWLSHTLSKRQINNFKLQEPQSKTSSLIIPCYYKHAPYLYDLLVMYEYQTKLPDEVVISLSQADLVEVNILEKLTEERWSFPVTLILTNEQKYGGENRNRACQHAKGDIFICQDADDLVHEQRIEIIHYFFEHFAIDHLMHEYCLVKPNEHHILFQTYDPTAIQFWNSKKFETIWQRGRFTNGNVAISRWLFQNIQWTDKPRAQDTLFNRQVYSRYYKTCIVINAILYGYRQYLSSDEQNDSEAEVPQELVYSKKPNGMYSVEIICV